MSVEQHTTAMDALLATVDAVIRTTGGDPTELSADDKLLLAAQYIEVSAIQAVIATINTAGRVRL